MLSLSREKKWALRSINICTTMRLLAGTHQEHGIILDMRVVEQVCYNCVSVQMPCILRGDDAAPERSLAKDSLSGAFVFLDHPWSRTPRRGAILHHLRPET